LRQTLPDLQVLILTVSQREEDLYEALRLGAAGYLLKDVDPRTLVEAILEVAAGEPRIAAGLARRMLDDLSPERAPDERLSNLSDREREVLSLLSEGLRNREIADRLVISEWTVKSHVRHVLDKLHFRNRAEAAAFAARHLP
jgi:DNA-binding NarL/FixJ family response regulator